MSLLWADFRPNGRFPIPRQAHPSEITGETAVPIQPPLSRPKQLTIPGKIGRIPTPPQARPGNGRTHPTPIIQAKPLDHRWED